MTFCPTGWFGRVFLKTGLVNEPYRGFAPDILLSGTDSIDLEKYGFQGHVRSTPGHTAGSISVELDVSLAEHVLGIGDRVGARHDPGEVFIEGAPEHAVVGDRIRPE